MELKTKFGLHVGTKHLDWDLSSSLHPSHLSQEEPFLLHILLVPGIIALH